MFDWLRSTGPGKLAVAALATALLATGLALYFTSGNDGGGGSAARACGIVASGAKLCGGDLAAYCRKFSQGSLDQQTVLACSEVGVDVVK